MSYPMLDPALALGIPVMDQSHRVIFDLLDGIDLLPRPEFDAACLRLTAALYEDLHEEDALMASIGYAGAEQHRAAHARLLETLQNALALLAHGDEQSARRAMSLLPQWIGNHIRSMDLALAVALTKEALAES